jgi:sugar phosphate isomerase/epimerase
VSALSAQLYSVREQAAADLPGTLARLAAIGLTRVEPFDLTADPHELREALDASGLSAPSAHAHLTDGADLARVLDAAAIVGVQTVIQPFSPPERWTTEEGVDAVAEDLAGALERAAGHGLRIGYHNHHWELASMLGGRTALELLADRVGPELVLELDTYWAAVGGQDVPALLGRLGDRVRMLHLKDGPIDTHTATQLPVGSGAMPVPAILAAAPAVELAVLEFDDYAGDVFEGIAAGYGYVTRLADGEGGIRTLERG